MDAQDGAPPMKDQRIKKPASNKDTKDFLFFNIPTFLNGSNLDPSPVANASVDLSGEELRLKLGIPGMFKRTTKWSNVKWFTATISPYTSSKDKKSKLYSKGSWTGTYGVDVGANVIPIHWKWTATDTGAYFYEQWSKGRLARNIDAVHRDTIRSGDRVSEFAGWFSARGNLEQKEYQLFFPGMPFDALAQKRTLGLGRGYASVSFYFHSILERKRWWNWMASCGYGTGSFTNYLTLSERTLQEGAVVYNADSSAVRMISETTSGRVGPMVISTGPVAYVEAYKTIAFFGHGEVRLGGRYDMMGMGTNNFNTRMAPGAFINVKKPAKKPGDEPSDVVNVAIIFQMDQFQLEHNEEYWDKYATLSVAAAFPLRFK